MPYGTVKVDNVTFTNNSVDATTTFSGIYASITNNLTLSGTATAATFTGTTANFTNVNAQNISVTTSLSGLAITGGTAGFTTITGTTVTGTTANFVSGVFTTRISGTTVTGTTANFVTVSGTTVTGNTGQFTNLAGAAAGFTTVTGTTITGTTANFVSGVFTTQILGTTVTGTTASFTSGVFTSLSGTTHTITSGVFASGTAALPSISFVSDPNTGIYSPGADQLAVATNGTGKLFVDASGNVGVGVSPGYKVEVRDSSAPLIRIGDGVRHVELRGGSTTQNPSLGTQYGGDLSFFTNGSANERLRITSAGLVGIGTSAPGEALTVTNGALQVSGTLSSLNRPSSSVMDFQISTGLTRFFSIGADASTHGAYSFCTATTTTNIERIRIDQSGRVLVGTSTARTNFNTGAEQSHIQLEGTTFNTTNLSIVRNSANDGTAALTLGKSRSATVNGNTVVVSGDPLGFINFEGADGTNMVRGASIAAQVDGTPGTNDMPGRLVFSTTADGAASPTERLRITNAGVLQVADAGNITVGTTTGTKIGTATTQKLGFYNATPVVQPTAVADATTAVDVITQLNNLLAKLRTLGIIAT